MENVLIVGDMHCKQTWILPYVDSVIKGKDVNRVVFLGDYLDDFLCHGDESMDQLEFHLKWLKKASRNVDVVHLCGNHDWSYLQESDGSYASGHDFSIHAQARDVLEKFKIKMSERVGQCVCSHAGITESWIMSLDLQQDEANAVDLLNDMYAESDNRLNSCGELRGGSDAPGPLWADGVETEFDEGLDLDQIVGHTPVCVASVKRRRNGSFVAYCDTFSTNASGRAMGDGSLLLAHVNGTVQSFETLRPKDFGFASWADQMKQRSFEIVMRKAGLL